MATDTLVTEHAQTEALLRELPNSTSLSISGTRFHASCYFPAGDVLRGAHCFGAGDTLPEAISVMLAELEQAKHAKQKLRTAAECKAAVLTLIREHDAAPAAFRDAVDELDVA